MNRIKKADLEHKVNELNRITGNPAQPWNIETRTSNPGCHVLQGAYGGWQLQQIVNESGGVSAISLGYISKREMYDFIQAYTWGIQGAKL